MLRGAIGVFSISALVGCSLLAASYYFREEMALEYRDHHGRFRDVSAKYLAVDEEEQIIAQYYPTFINLDKLGILGKEHRLNWLETLRLAGEKIRLPEISYRVNSQGVYEPEFPVDLGGYDIYVSEMDLTLGLLHEGDLLDLFHELDSGAEGLYSAARCDANRAGDGEEFDPARPTITANCQLHWFTIDLKGERELAL